MRIVSENSDGDIRRQRAEDALSWALRDLASNMLRVVRGAGKPYQLGREMIAAVEAMEAYRAAVGHWPPSDAISAMLSGKSTFDLKGLSDGEFNKEHAQETMIRGALQIVASRLAGQRIQESSGEREMAEGRRAAEAARKEIVREWSGKPDPTDDVLRRAKSKRRPKTKG